MYNYDNSKQNLEIAQMQVQADLIESLDAALNMTNKLHELVFFLDFKNQSTIQAYYNALTSAAHGFHLLTEGFQALAESHGLQLTTES